MKRKHTLMSLLLVGTLSASLIGCSMETSTELTSKLQTKSISDSSSDSQSVSGKTTDDTFISAQTDFSVKLFQHALSKSEGNNVLISPLSTQLALAMTANGADGQTKEEMENVLGVEFSIDELNEYLYYYVKNLPANDTCKLQIANSIWIRDNDDSLTVEEEFLKTNATYYDAKIYKSSFNNQTIKDINKWVQKNTDGLINKIVEEIDPNTIMYLINALTFDAHWQNAYKREEISDGRFTAISGEKRTVEMMTSSEDKYIDDGKATGFIKDYNNGNYRFIALLPNEDIDIYDYINGLTKDSLIETLNSARNEIVMATMPKFSYDYTLHMNDILKQMGISTAFDDTTADFSKLVKSTTGNIYISDVLHKTFISVDELGTKAGAVTKVEMAEKSMMESRLVITLDRPFVYIIVDGENNLPLFIGTVVDIK